jgi:hypothetical protein
VGRIIATAVLLLAADPGLAAAAGLMQAPLEARDLAQYRLTEAVFDRFQAASRAIAAATRNDPALARNPLFSRDVLVSDDVKAAAMTLESRLASHPALGTALGDARLTARDYTTFALALVAARLAHGFVKTGVLRRVPDGVAAANVAFVAAHEQEIGSVLADLGIDG